MADMGLAGRRSQNGHVTAPPPAEASRRPQPPLLSRVQGHLRRTLQQLKRLVEYELLRERAAARRASRTA